MKYNLTAIRKLIAEAFDDEELTLFCHEYFGEVIERFGSGMGKSAKVLQLVTYCDRREELDRLLEKVEVRRPKKYQKYRAQLEGGEDGPPVVSETGTVKEGEQTISDVYSAYEVGLSQLLHRLGQGHPLHVEVLVYQQRFFENITQSRRHGDTDTRKAERSEIVGQLNRIALSALGMSFSELCGLG